VLMGGKALASIIREGKTSMISSYMQSGAGQGMQTMDQSLMMLVQAGKIKPEDAALKAMDRSVFEKMAAGGGKAPAHPGYGTPSPQQRPPVVRR